MDIRQLFGRNLKRIRTDLGLTQEAFAETSGFSQQYLSGLERGHRNPTLQTVVEIANALSVSHLELLAPDGASDATDLK